MKKLSLSILGLILALGLVVPELAFAAPTQIGTNSITRSSVTQTATAVDVTNGNKIYLKPGLVLVFRNPNADGNACTVTIADQLGSNTGVQTNASFAVAFGETRYAGPFSASRWADGSGMLQISYTGTTNTTITGVELPYGKPERDTR